MQQIVWESPQFPIGTAHRAKTPMGVATHLRVMMNRGLSAFVFCALLSGRELQCPAQTNDTWQTMDPRYQHASPKAVERWRDLKYGLRICWGQYNLWNIEASWPVLKMSNVRKQDYFDLYKQFNPVEFDAEKWMDLLNRGGLKFFTILTKHHDGFSMFNTQTRVKRRVNWMAAGGPSIEPCDLAYSIMDSPFHRDSIQELCEAAHRRGIAIDLYFSHCDWFDADFRGDPDHPLHDPAFSKQKEGDSIRFTRTKDTNYVYAISLNWPGQTLKLTQVRPRAGSVVRMLGLEQPLRWHLDPSDGLVIELPEELQSEAARSSKQAYVFKIGAP